MERESVSGHFGPEWCWDQSRPEAIRARAQMEEFRKLLVAAQRARRGERAARTISARSLATRFMQGAGRA